MGDEYERAVARAHRGWEWWIVIASIVYIAVRIIPWIAHGFPVTDR